MQRVKNGDGVGTTEGDGAHVALPDIDDRVRTVEGEPCALDVPGHQLDPAQTQWFRRCRPVGWPVTRFMAPAGGEQPGKQAALAAAEVEKVSAGGEDAASEQFGEDAVAGEFAACIVVSEVSAGAKRAARVSNQRGQESRIHSRAALSVTGLIWWRAIVCSSRGRTAMITGSPAAVRAAWPSCRSRMSPAASSCVNRR